MPNQQEMSWANLNQAPFERMDDFPKLTPTLVPENSDSCQNVQHFPYTVLKSFEFVCCSEQFVLDILTGVQSLSLSLSLSLHQAALFF